MSTLADMGTEIMWCDVGGPNLTTQWASEWFNAQGRLGRQVAINARCGLPGDFDTPEYATYGAVQRREWESSAGMDPFSYGYNRATPESKYMNASTIVKTLVDIVSKNGNFLLDIGPTANGTILPVEKRNLRRAGTWIHSHAEAIFNTTYWFVRPDSELKRGDTDVRFTRTGEAFYLLFLERPETGVVRVSSPVPWVEADDVRVVGGKMDGRVVRSEKHGDGVRLNVSREVWEADEFCWVFKITY
jgi:alpha-L-fucosidase